MRKLRQLLYQFGAWARSEETRPTIRTAIGTTILVAVPAFLLVAVQMVPEWQVRRANVQPTVAKPEKPTTRADVAALQNEMRRTFIQVVGGVFAILALYFTYRRVKVAEQGHITDRCTKAIEQLGALTADGKPNIEVPLGAIYALERIAHDSARDHWTIMEVLTAYVRQNAPAPTEEPMEEENNAAMAKGPPTEIRAILTVLGRRWRGRSQEREEHRLDLRQSDLRGADLAEKHIERAIFAWARLQGANLEGVHAKGALFGGAHLERTSFHSAHLEGAGLDIAHLQGAGFHGARLEGARLVGAHLEGAFFDHACLRGASILGRTSTWRASLGQISKGQISDTQPA
jgi:hypothetical protein